MKQKYLNHFIFGLLAVMITVALSMHYMVAQSTENLKNEEIKRTAKYAEKIAQFILLETNGKIESALDKDKVLRKKLNEALFAFMTEEFRYIFLLLKDPKGIYRFLLDGSLEDPAEYKMPFFPKSNQYDTVYMMQNPQIIKRSEGVDQVWVSLVYPIIDESETALLVMDLSKEYGQYLNEFHSPLEFVVRLMNIFLIMSLLLLAFLAYRFYKLRKSMLQDATTSAYTKLYLQEFFDVRKVNQYHAILIDIDGFKYFNEKYGYASGDYILKLFTKEISGFLPKSSKVIRMGGAEFFVIIKKNSGKIEHLAKSLFNHLKEKRYLLGNDVISLALSVSAIDIPKEASSIDRIYRLLDEKLLEIKSRGKNGLGIIDELSSDAIKYKNIDYIREALEEERLVCLYQPIFDTQSQQIVKYEALVRLVDKDDPEKLVSPFYFLDLIKGTTQYIKMSKLVFEEAFQALNTYPDIEISINMDLYDLYNADMIQIITEELYQNRKLANRLTFEIIESNEIEDFDRVELIFKQLKAFGSKIAIDDFGSGYANYSYMINIDADILKIDGSIVRELMSNRKRAKIALESINQLALSYKYDVVAEFVSCEEIYEMVRDLGIQYSQGFYLGEPKPLEEYVTENA